MRSIDIHAHLMPRCFWEGLEGGGEWHGVREETVDGLAYTVSGGRRDLITTPKLRFTPEQRLRDMDELGTDVQVVSIPRSQDMSFPRRWLHLLRYRPSGP